MRGASGKAQSDDVRGWSHHHGRCAGLGGPELNCPLLTAYKRSLYSYSWSIKERNPVGKDKADLLPGTLDLLVLKTVETMGPIHGWGIAKRIEQVSEDLLEMKYGTLYPA